MAPPDAPPTGSPPGARLRGWAVLAWAALSMAALFLASLPAMLATGRPDLSLWFARRVWSPSSLRLAGVRLALRRTAPLPEGPAVYASNHESALDVFALLVSIPRDLRFVAKRELFRIPVFGWYLRLAGFVEVDRRDRTQALSSLGAAAGRLRGGTSLVVFPEGTRSRDGRVGPFKRGPFVLAQQASVPVVPVALIGAGAVTPKARIEVHPGTILVVTGEPVDPAAWPDKNDLLREVRRRIIALHRAHGGLGGDEEDAVAPPGVEGAARAG
ncbi:lysophospholipid acyltransferase family protein [Anaeromyxobacter paludicola]|uniref:1-acyl-sn-glycerol-3-phosphate acyltransferase n=1 Tax=Anaeromyxobacter paludicola TaxID=2918171 RepID=A0ABN6N450_9BACT|nr:lysophospholipid acyltransferase family protein [Anaeromyxobacter paludicola]BDG07756.1 hypothetical protein AMPC_08690 [Anaeromyxobacter paludicola]